MDKVSDTLFSKENVRIALAGAAVIGIVGTAAVTAPVAVVAAGCGLTGLAAKKMWSWF